MWNIFKLVELHYIRRRYSMYVFKDWKKDIASFYCENKKRQFKHLKKNKKNIWTRLLTISKHDFLILEVLQFRMINLESNKKGSLATQWNVQWNISKIQYLTPLKLGMAIIGLHFLAKLSLRRRKWREG